MVLSDILAVVSVGLFFGWFVLFLVNPFRWLFIDEMKAGGDDENEVLKHAIERKERKPPTVPPAEQTPAEYSLMNEQIRTILTDNNVDE